MLTRLRYVDTYGLTSTSGSIGKQLFIINSTFDPDSTGVGHQPLYRDTYAAIYDQYAVVSAKIKVTFTSNSTTSPMICGASFDDDVTTSTSIYALMEQNTGKHLLLPNNSGSLSTKSLTFNWDCKRMLGIDPFASQTYKTAVGSNPTEQATFVVYAQPTDVVSTTVTGILVEIDYVVLFTELQTPTIS